MTKQASKRYSYYTIFLFAAALLLRLILAAFSEGFSTDTTCFTFWGTRMYELGPGGFYSPDVFTDYPPGYMYLLYPFGALYTLLKLSYLGPMHLMLLRLPAITCDLLAAFALERVAAKKLGKNMSLILAGLYLFNPVIILNSCIWGQVDSVLTLTMVLMIIFLEERKMLPAYIAFGIGILIKPQALFLAPVILLAFIDEVILNRYSTRKLLMNLGQIASVVVGMVLLAMPFGLKNVVDQLLKTMGSYPYATVNAYNFWGLMDKNWVSQSNPFLGLPIQVWGWASILLLFVFVAVLFFRRQKPVKSYALLGALLLIGIFTFSVRMHERYVFPAIILLLLAFVKKPTKWILYAYGALSALHFANTAHILYYYDPTNYNPDAPVIFLTGAGMTILAIACIYLTATKNARFAQLSAKGAPANATLVAKAPAKSDSADTSANNTDGDSSTEDAAFAFGGFRKLWERMTAPLPPAPTEKNEKFSRLDWIIVFAITAIYSAIALYDLGDMTAPSTSYKMEYEDTITIDFGGKTPAKLHYFIAPWQGRTMTVSAKNPSDSLWKDCGEIELSSVFTWQEVDLSVQGSQLLLTLKETQAEIMEFVFFDQEGNRLRPSNVADYPYLFDEFHLLPERSNFRNSMYFDEIYHGRTAYEFLNDGYTYENTHPPLGKIFISIGVAIFGMNPFGWRIIGTLFGIAMVPITYVFAKKLTKNRIVTTLACVLFTFDFMHFTQTRIATIDVYGTFFIMLMYFFMYRYCTMSFYDSDLKKTFLPLGACGVCMGLGVASKWTGAYAGIGLAILFFATLYRRYREYKYATLHPREYTETIPHKKVIREFKPNTTRTIGFCMIFFVAIPFLIYLLSYIPFNDGRDDGIFARMLRNQVDMFSYHSNEATPHPYSSRWYEWPLIVRPVWYFSSIVTGSYLNGGLREGISAFGNPLVWWIGIPITFVMLYLALFKKDKKATFLLVGYAAQFLPWTLISRTTYMYHYFPSVIFIVLMIAYAFQQCAEHLGKKKLIFFCSIYGAAVIALFILFYPVLSGQPVEAEFVTRWLRWFDSWVLTLT